MAQGYAFVASAGAAQGIGAYNTAFVGSVTKLWPDRRIDQEKSILSLGYRTDQKTVIAKEDHGSYYAFFPLATFLNPGLQKLFLNDPAVFLNPAEAVLGIGTSVQSPSGQVAKSSRKSKGSEDALYDLLLNLAGAIKGNENITSGQLLVELVSPCPGPNCAYVDSDLIRVMTEKTLFAKASLNSVKIVIRGIMTIPVDSIPPTIDTVTFDSEKNGASAWTFQPPAPVAEGVAPPVAGAPVPNTLTGEITGKFLTGGIPAITALSVPGVDNPKVTDFITDKSLQPVSSKTTDSALPFTLKLAKTIPAGAKLTFEVSRTSSNSAGSTSSTVVAGTSTQLTSNKFVYTIS